LAELDSAREEAYQIKVDLDEKQVEVDEAKDTITSLQEQLAELHKSMEEDAGLEDEDEEEEEGGSAKVEDEGGEEVSVEAAAAAKQAADDHEARADLELQLKLATADADKAKSELKMLKEKTGSKSADKSPGDAKEAKKLEAKAVVMVKEGIAKGMKSWPAKKGECRDVYLKLVAELETFLPSGTRGFAHLKKASTFASTQKAGGAAVTLKRELEKFRQLLDGGSARSGGGTATASKRREAEAKAKEAKVQKAAEAHEAKAKAKMEVLQAKLDAAKAKAPSTASNHSARSKPQGSGEDHGGGKSPRGHAGGNKAVKAALARAKAAEKHAQQLEHKLSEARKDLRLYQDEVRHGGGSAGSAGSAGGGGGSGSSAADRRKIRELEKEMDKLRKMQSSASHGEMATAPAMGKGSKAGSSRDLKSRGGGSPKGDAASDAKIKGLERRLAESDKKMKKAAEEAEKKQAAAVKKAQREAGGASKKLAAAEEENKTLEEQKKKLKAKVKDLEEMTKDLGTLKERAVAADIAEAELKETKKEVAKLEVSYKEEQTLRKKYYNIIEDMKGKIRVYARCRPMARYELEKGCAPVVTFVDETTLELATARGPREFLYDQVFSPQHSQEEVFEDTKHLIQSAIDGFNVCVFAYGQTGSGKTFTMGGTQDYPGVTPRAVAEIYKIAAEQEATIRMTVTCSFVELYNDKLIDLFHVMKHGRKQAGPDLAIKKNAKGMVVLSNVVYQAASNTEELLALFEKGNKCRKVGSTKMNAESSRSHSIFAVLIECYNKTTKKTSIGKFSLIDLAGSERVGKTGATADRLKEAQSINKSLSALGDVISALSTNEKFIPYRNNKLTQLMQDSLGGNAKTLMFVNISPADYNVDETQTSLTYASRVKLITNDANKNQESEEVAKLKKMIHDFKAGKDVDLDDV
jgi:hypothetical protein